MVRLASTTSPTAFYTVSTVAMGIIVALGFSLTLTNIDMGGTDTPIDECSIGQYEYNVMSLVVR